MRYVTLGRTGLRVSVLGLGCGGPSRLGLKQGADRDHAVRIIRAALDQGVTLLDTAQAYTTEPQVAQAIADSGRDGVVVTTKIAVGTHQKLISVPDFHAAVHQSLTALRTDRLDVLMLHGVEKAEYADVTQRFVPELQKLRAQGKIRFLGISENFNVAREMDHGMLRAALAADCWDVVMLGFSVLNQTARASVLPLTRAQNVGTLCMYAVRRVLSDPQRLRDTVAKLIAEGKIDAPAIDANNPLGFLTAPGLASSIIEACYRFALHEPGLDTVLTGTGNLDHLRANLAIADLPPLPPETSARLRQIFARVDNVCGN